MSDPFSAPLVPLPPSAALFLSALLRHTQEAVLVIDAQNLQVLDINAQACAWLQRTQQEVLGMPIASIECALQDIFFWSDLQGHEDAGQIRVSESEWLRADGSIFPVQKRVVGVVEGGQRYWLIFVEDQTRKRRMDEEQLELASQLQSSLEAIAEGILTVDLNGRVVNWNSRFVAFWQMPDALLADRDVHAFMDQIGAQLTDPARLREEQVALQEYPGLPAEYPLTLSDGRHVVWTAKPEYLRDRLIGRVYSVRDISSMKRVEQELRTARDEAMQASREKSRMLDALRTSESRLRGLINSSLVGIVQAHDDGRVREANAVLLRLIGVSRETLVAGQLNWMEMLAEPWHEAHRQALAEAHEQQAAHSYQAEMISGEQRVPVMVGVARLEESANEWVGFVLDLSEQHKADRIKSEFISVVSHELRTPLTSIRGALGLLESGVMGELGPKALPLVQVAHKNSQRLGALVNDLLDMEKLASGKMKLNIERIDLVLLTRQALEANAAYAANLGVHYALESSPEQAWVNGDSDRVMQVFANLMSNAAKFSPKGETVDLRITDEGGQYRIEVRDRGPGIPEAFRSRIFGRFAQADGTDTRQQGGTGLGLNITKTLVEKMGGEIGFTTELGAGTTFWFTLVAGVRRRSDR